VIDQAKKCLLDWLGCAIRGAAQQPAAIVRSYVDLLGGAAQATILGSAPPSSLYNAALANGFFGHILEMDDVHRQSISHPAAAVIPAALSVGEWKGATGEELLRAVIAGYEVMLRIGSAVTPGHYRIWHTTATTGVFGSTIAAGLLLGLDEQQLTWAFGNAGTMAAGLWEFLHDGAMSKYLHAGKAAATGVMAAALAQFGLSGAQRILEGDQGFFAGYARQDVDSSFFEDFGSRFVTLAVSFKPYPCCRHTHSSVDCAGKLHARLAGRLDAVSRIAIETYSQAVQVANLDQVVDAHQAQFSLKHCVAVGLLRGSVTLQDFEPPHLGDPALKSLQARMRVSVAPDLDRLVPEAWPARIRVETRDGKMFEETVRYPKGDPENPLSWEELTGKFMLLAEPVISRSAAQDLVAMCRNLDTLNECTQLMRRASRE
jgi:2-methylcitrate dehydratase PrpD